MPQEEVAELCATFASNWECGEPLYQLPLPGAPDCDAIFLTAWFAFRYVTTQLGHQLLIAAGSTRHRLDPLEAFVRGRDGVPAYERWAEAEALIRAGEWSAGLNGLQPTQQGGWRSDG